MPSGDYSPDVRFDTQTHGPQSRLERRLWKNNNPGYRLTLHVGCASLFRSRPLFTAAQANASVPRTSRPNPFGLIFDCIRRVELCKLQTQSMHHRTTHPWDSPGQSLLLSRVLFSSLSRCQMLEIVSSAM